VNGGGKPRNLDSKKQAKITDLIGGRMDGKRICELSDQSNLFRSKD